MATSLDDWLRRSGRRAYGNMYDPGGGNRMPPPDTDPTGRQDPSGQNTQPPPSNVWDMWQYITDAFHKVPGSDWVDANQQRLHDLYNVATNTWSPDAIKYTLGQNWMKAYYAAMEALQIPGWKPYYDRSDPTHARHFTIPGWDYGFESGLNLPGEIDPSQHPGGYVWT